MRYHKITTDDMNNGPGLRVVLWTAGCEHHCKGCHNSFTWDPNKGIDDEDSEYKPVAFKLYDELIKDHITGITYSGGDPLHPNNRNVIAAIVFATSMNFPEKTQWLYTGYTWEQLIKMDDKDINNILSKIDVLVDGKFEEDLLCSDTPWIGSSNQRIINCKKSLIEKKIVLMQ